MLEDWRGYPKSARTASGRDPPCYADATRHHDRGVGACSLKFRGRFYCVGHRRPGSARESESRKIFLGGRRQEIDLLDSGFLGALEQLFDQAPSDASAAEPRRNYSGPKQCQAAEFL